MNFLPTDDQAAVVASLAELCERSFPDGRLGELAETGEGIDTRVWRDLTEFGTFMLVEEGIADAALAAEVLGKALIPGPVVATMLAPLLPEGSVGDGPIGLIDLTDDQPILVEHPDVITALVMLTDDGVSVLSGDELRAAPGLLQIPEPMDPLTPLASVPSLAAGQHIGGPDLATFLRQRGAVLTSAFQVGIAAAVIGQAVAYVSVREQFGKPVGSFQAVQHICADMLARSEVATAAARSAAVILDDPDAGDIARAIPAAKILADEAATLNAKACIQVHGGMGFTWEVQTHYFLKRAWVLSTQYGTVDTYCDALAAVL
jgi:hypothetical protein